MTGPAVAGATDPVDLIGRAVAIIGAGGSGHTRSRSGADLVHTGDAVVKVHHPRTGEADLGRRLQVCRGLPEVFVQPLLGHPVRVQVAGVARVASVWQPVEPLVATGPEQVDWTAIGATLARLHAAPSPVLPSPGLPPHGGLARLRRVTAAFTAGTVPDAAAEVADLAALARLGAELTAALTCWSPVYGPSLVHGDWHLGQVAATADGWLLLDIDDLGLGTPAWDLGRPAGAWAAGLLDDDSLVALIAGYRHAGGPGLPPDGAWWPQVDLAARASVLIATYGLLRDLPLPAEEGEVLTNLLAACERMRG